MKNYTVFILNILLVFGALYALTRGFYLSLAGFLSATYFSFDWLAEKHICLALGQPSFKRYPQSTVQISLLVAITCFAVGV